MGFIQKTISDPSALSLAFANLIVIALATIEGWNLATVLWVYWCQSIIIGFFSLMRMFSIRDYSTEGVLIGDKPVLPSPSTKAHLAVAFIAGYGGLSRG